MSPLIKRLAKRHPCPNLVLPYADLASGFSLVKSNNSKSLDFKNLTVLS